MTQQQRSFKKFKIQTSFKKSIVSVITHCTDKNLKLCIQEKHNGSWRVWVALSLHIICQMGQHRACWRGRQGHILPPLALCKIYFWDVQFKPVWVCQVVVRQSTSLRLLSMLWNHHNLTAENFFLKYVRQAASLVVVFQSVKTFPPDLITRVFLVSVLYLFTHWIKPTAAWDLLLHTYRCCQHIC